MKLRYSADESFDIGRDSERRQAGPQLTGRIIEKVVIDLAVQKQIDHEMEFVRMLCHGRL
jgi:hypothetical protein